MADTYDFVISARNIVDKKKFGDENAPCSYLLVPGGEELHPRQSVKNPNLWAKRVIAEARRGVKKPAHGHVLFFVHGYNNSPKTVLERHRRIRDDLAREGFKGVVVSFDWPSGDIGPFYLEDLKDAHDSAHQLVADGILLLARLQEPECNIDVHLLAHSMGAYVVRQAFTWADDADELTGQTWRVSQILLIAPDISARSLQTSDQRSNGLYRACNRLTCYSNRHDDVLGLSNVKRAGVAPRAGRIGLPDGAPGHAVDVDCSAYWERIPSTQRTIGNRKHSWHIGDPIFTRDLIDTMIGVDRDVMTTRALVALNRFRLVPPA